MASIWNKIDGYSSKIDKLSQYSLDKSLTIEEKIVEDVAQKFFEKKASFSDCKNDVDALYKKLKKLHKKPILRLIAFIRSKILKNSNLSIGEQLSKASSLYKQYNDINELATENIKNRDASCENLIANMNKVTGSSLNSENLEDFQNVYKEACIYRKELDVFKSSLIDEDIQSFKEAFQEFEDSILKKLNDYTSTLLSESREAEIPNLSKVTEFVNELCEQPYSIEAFQLKMADLLFIKNSLHVSYQELSLDIDDQLRTLVEACSLKIDGQRDKEGVGCLLSSYSELLNLGRHVSDAQHIEKLTLNEIQYLDLLLTFESYFSLLNEEGFETDMLWKTAAHLLSKLLPENSELDSDLIGNIKSLNSLKSVTFVLKQSYMNKYEKDIEDLIEKSVNLFNKVNQGYVEQKEFDHIRSISSILSSGLLKDLYKYEQMDSDRNRLVVDYAKKLDNLLYYNKDLELYATLAFIEHLQFDQVDGVFGIRNLGNTCCLNTALMNFFSNPVWVRELDKINLNKISDIEPRKIVFKFLKNIQSQQAKGTTLFVNRREVSEEVSKLYSYLSDVMRDTININIQADASEILIKILEALDIGTSQLQLKKSYQIFQDSNAILNKIQVSESDSSLYQLDTEKNVYIRDRESMGETHFKVADNDLDKNYSSISQLIKESADVIEGCRGCFQEDSVLYEFIGDVEVIEKPGQIMDDNGVITIKVESLYTEKPAEQDAYKKCSWVKPSIYEQGGKRYRLVSSIFQWGETTVLYDYGYSEGGGHYTSFVYKEGQYYYIDDDKVEVFEYEKILENGPSTKKESDLLEMLNQSTTAVYVDEVLL